MVTCRHVRAGISGWYRDRGNACQVRRVLVRILKWIVLLFLSQGSEDSMNFPGAASPSGTPQPGQLPLEPSV